MHYLKKKHMVVQLASVFGEWKESLEGLLKALLMFGFLGWVSVS